MSCAFAAAGAKSRARRTSVLFMGRKHATVVAGKGGPTVLCMSFQVVLLSALLQVVGPSAGKQNPPGEVRPERPNPLGGIKEHYQAPPPLAPQDLNTVATLHQT